MTIPTLFAVYPAETKMINSNIGIKIIQDKAIYFNADGQFISMIKMIIRETRKTRILLIILLLQGNEN